LPELLQAQLADDGFEPTEAAACAQQINQAATPVTAAPLFVSLGSCKFLEGDIDGAVAAWRHVITGGHDPAASRALLNLGLLYEHLHLYDRALSVLDSTVERAVVPHADHATMAAARVRCELGDVEAALESMARHTQSIMAAPSDEEGLAETLYAFGDLAFHAGRLDRAERAWRAAATSPTSAAQSAAKERLTTLLIEAGRVQELADLFDDQQSHDGAFDDVLRRADALVRSGDDQGAIDLARITNGASATEVQRFQLADMRRRLGLINEAIDELEPMLVSPQVNVRQRAAFMLGQIYQDHDMADAAVAMFESVVSQPDDFWSFKAAISLGDILSDRRQREQALEQWTFASTSPAGALRTIASERLELAFSHPAEPEIGQLDGVAPDGAVEAAPIDELDPEIVLLDEPEPMPAADLLLEVEPHVLLLGDLEDGESAAVFPLGELRDGLPPADLVEGSSPQDAAQVLILDDIDGDVPLPSPESDPSHVVVLDELESQEALVTGTEPDTGRAIEPRISEAALAEPAIETPATPSQVVGSAFRSLSTANPYAALAPEANDGDPAPSLRNPYAELAPNYDKTQVPDGATSGDWEALLDDWPIDRDVAASDDDTTSTDKEQPSAFSRYT